ncbi:transposase [Niabella ginsenosidivorans]|nr:transposase [Niabella ginsenosidivorans]
MWKQHQQQVHIIDQRIALLLKDLVKDKPEVKKDALGKTKSVRHHKPEIKNLHVMMVQLFGVNVSSIAGINDYTLLRLIGETGVDMSRFPSMKQFTSWCSLSPGHHQSGKKSKWIKRAPCNKAGQIFKEAAQSLENSKHNAIGAFIRRLKARRGPAVAYKAGGRKIAEAFYNTLTKGVEYVEQGVKKYEQQLKAKELSLLQKFAKKHKLQVVDN